MTRSHCTFSFTTFHFSPNWGLDVPVDRMLHAARAAGFDAVGVDLKTVRRLQENGTSLTDLRTMIDVAGLTCSDVMPLPVGPDVGTTIVAAREFADMARILRAPTCIATVPLQASDVEDASRRKLFRECAAVLADAETRIALEYLPYSPVTRIDQTAELCAHAGWDRAGVLVDVWHTSVTDQMAEIGSLSAEQIAFVQFNDAVLPLSEDVVVESRTRRRLPGLGNLDLTRFVDTLTSLGYAGVVSPEILSAPAREELDVEGFTRDVLRATKDYWR